MVSMIFRASVTLCFKYKYRTKEGMSLLDEDITIFKRVVSRTGQKYIVNNEVSVQCYILVCLTKLFKPMF